MLLKGPYTSETVIAFLYKYTAHNARGVQLWESRVSQWCFTTISSFSLSFSFFAFRFSALCFFALIRMLTRVVECVNGAAACN